MNATDILARVKEDNVKFVSLQFVDVTGTVKSLDIPVDQLSDALERGRIQLEREHATEVVGLVPPLLYFIVIVVKGTIT